MMRETLAAISEFPGPFAFFAMFVILLLGMLLGTIKSCIVDEREKRLTELRLKIQSEQIKLLENGARDGGGHPAAERNAR